VMYSMTATTLLNLIASPVSGILIDRYQVRWVMAAGGLWFAAGLWLLSKVTSITQFIAVFAVTLSVATSLATSTAASAVISRWFTVSRGRALGVAAVGTSAGGVLVPKLMAEWIGDGGWRAALENVALCALVVMLPIVIATVRGQPADVGMDPEPLPEGAVASAADTQALTIGQILHNRGFWCLGLSLGLLFSTYSAMLSNLTPYVVDLGHNKESAAGLIMTVAIAGFVGKLLFGMAADKFSPKLSLATAQALVIVGFLILALEPAYPMLIVACAFLGLASGGMLPVWGSMMARIFGLLSYGRAMGLMGPVLTVCIMPGYAIAGRLYDTSGSFTVVLTAFAVVVVAAILLLLPLRVNSHQVQPAER